MLLIHAISSLHTMDSECEIKDAAILIDQDKIFWCGALNNCPKVSITHSIDAKKKLVIPGLIDCHSHLIFAGSRPFEFARRMNNETYQAIMAEGGGIMSTVNSVRGTSDEILLKGALSRADAIFAQGVTTLEAKSGYGLSVIDEIRILHLQKQLNEIHPIDIHSTFLGAHVVPLEWRHDRKHYINLVVEEMLPLIAQERLAVDCDVFCENGAFSVAESAVIFERALELGFGLRAHVNQLGPSGGVSLLNTFPIKSISHADYLSLDDIKAIASANTVVEFLPFASLFLRSKTMNVLELKKENIPIAVATDFNPGSAMCHDLVLATRLAVTYGGLPLSDALPSITVNAARSLRRDDIGIIKPGAKADIVITNCDSVAEFFYDWTKHPVNTVIKNGRRNHQPMV